MSIEHGFKMTAFPCTFSYSKKSGSLDVLNVWRFISIAATLSVIVAHETQHGHVQGAMLERQSSYAWVWPRLSHFWCLMVCSFTKEPWKRLNDPLKFDESWDAIGHRAFKEVSSLCKGLFCIILVFQGDWKHHIMTESMMKDFQIISW